MTSPLVLKHIMSGPQSWFNSTHSSISERHLSCVIRKPVFGFPTNSDTNLAVHPQKMARGSKFWIKEVEGLYYLCCENKGADQLPVILQLICTFVFAHAKSRISGDLVYKFKKIRGMTDFSDQFRKIIMRYKRIGASLKKM